MKRTIGSEGSGRGATETADFNRRGSSPPPRARDTGGWLELCMRSTQLALRGPVGGDTRLGGAPSAAQGQILLFVLRSARNSTSKYQADPPRLAAPRPLPGPFSTINSTDSRFGRVGKEGEAGKSTGCGSEKTRNGWIPAKLSKNALSILHFFSRCRLLLPRRRQARRRNKSTTPPGHGRRRGRRLPQPP